MRIAMIGHKSIYLSEGGIEKTVRHLALFMADRGHEITVYDRSTCVPPADRMSDQDDRYGNTKKIKDKVKVIKVPTVSGAAEVPLYSFFAAVHAAFHNYDAVIFHASGPCFMLPIVKLAGRKTIAFIHGLDSRSSKWGRFAKRYLAAGEKTAAKKSDRLLVLSEPIRDYFEQQYRRSAEMVINGTEPPMDLTGSEEILHTPDRYGLAEDSYFFWSGRISPEKGLQYLIPAFMNCDTDKKLVLAGSIDKRKKSYYEKLHPICRQDPRILFIGNQSPASLQVLYKNAFAFVFPSEQEGMAHSLLEAQVNGAACILSDIPENRAIAKDNALYFQSKKADDLQEKMQYLLRNPGLREKLTKGQSQKIVSAYSCEKSGEQILGICREVCNT